MEQPLGGLLKKKGPIRGQKNRENIHLAKNLDELFAVQVIDHLDHPRQQQLQQQVHVTMVTI